MSSGPATLRLPLPGLLGRSLAGAAGAVAAALAGEGCRSSSGTPGPTVTCGSS